MLKLLLLLPLLLLAVSSGQLGMAELQSWMVDRPGRHRRRTADTAGICTSILESNGIVRLRVLPGPVLAPPQHIWRPPRRNWGQEREHT